jgi:hypothetical protein
LSFAEWQRAMREGDFARAWRISDEVLAGRDRRLCDNPALPYHERFVWDGSDPGGRHVLVRCYHGLGDTLQFARFLPALADIASSVTLEAQPELCGLLSTWLPIIRTMPFDPAHPLPPADCNLEIMELAHALRVRDVSANHDYLAVAAPGVQAGKRIGVCWAAGDWDSARSIPPARLFDALDGHGAGLYSLQRGPAADALDPALRERLRNPDDRSMQVADTAALIATLDIVVTVDSFVAHLAGAMGKPACILLKHEADWRWMLGQRTAWYPRARLFRQLQAGAWEVPLEEVRMFFFEKKNQKTFVPWRTPDG